MTQRSLMPPHRRLEGNSFKKETARVRLSKRVARRREGGATAGAPVLEANVEVWRAQDGQAYLFVDDKALAERGLPIQDSGLNRPP